MVPGRVRGRDGAKQLSEGRRSGAQPDRVPANRLLALLPAATLLRLEPHLQPVHVRRADILFRAHEPLSVAYFPDSAVVSLVSSLASGESLEVGLVGRDGVAGTISPGITTMPCDGIVQIPGVAQCISIDVFYRESLADARLHAILGSWVQLQIARTMQLSVCNMFHSVEQRCVRWLLTVSDLLDNGCIPLTHELLATMLGVHRPTVTQVLRSLHNARLVDESRGRIEVRDRGRLEKTCCECYRVLRDEQRRVIGS